MSKPLKLAIVCPEYVVAVAAKNYLLQNQCICAEITDETACFFCEVKASIAKIEGREP